VVVVWSPQYGGLHAELEAIEHEICIIAHRLRDCTEALNNLHSVVPNAEKKEL
jgi:prefoldin subunit 5